MRGRGPRRAEPVRETERVSARNDATVEVAYAAAWTPRACQRGAVAAIDLDALRSNIATVRALVGDVEVMAVVKADAYGHGLVPCARAALEAGATWLGVALLDEAITLRDAGVEGRVLAWRACTSRSTPASRATERQPVSGRSSSRRLAQLRSTSSSRSSASGRTSRAPMCRRTRRSPPR